MLASIDMHRKNPCQLATISTIISTMADLLVRGVEESVVRALKKRAGEHGRIAEAEDALARSRTLQGSR